MHEGIQRVCSLQPHTCVSKGSEHADEVLLLIQDKRPRSLSPLPTPREQLAFRYMQLLVARATMTGFVIFDYADRYGEGVVRLADWLRSGELRSREQVVQGDVGDFPEVLLALFRGDNTGKLVLALDGS